MFGYRHAFHAGNHADVLKHTILLGILRYIVRKDAPVFYVDTHAGAGIYALGGRESQKNREFENGVARLWKRNALPALLTDYTQMVQRANSEGKLDYYPGSPFIAEQVLRAQDRLRLFEAHPREADILADNVGRWNTRGGGIRGQRVMANKSDGFSALLSLLPPPSRRALILIDPPYENREDYRTVIRTLQKALKRFADGVYMVWFPLLQRQEVRHLSEQLKKGGREKWLEVTLQISRPVPDGFGLTGSGVFVVNPPWTLENELRQTLPFLVEVLGQDKSAAFRIEAKGNTRPG
ncbi:MAG: 23S rRNA (adenine(2030)-N(6))-methyltransferase RlmJ [Burkholderiaceae bacterium]|nr:23S rRNA (adenine(2030)-N(6))-methyltransferase RlmJ [Burkholderiaceae bacterium]